MDNQILNKKIPKYNYVVVVLAMFITDNPVFMYSTNGLISNTRQYLILALPLILLAVLFLKTKKLVVHRTGVILVCLFSINVILANLSAGDSLNAAMMIVAKVCFAFLFPLLVNRSEFESIFIRVMRAICISSLVLFAAAYFKGSLISLLPKLTVLNASGNGIQTIATVYLSNAYINIPKWAARNFGPFWEPGAFATYLNMLLFILLFSIGKYKGKLVDIIIAAVTLITTVSLGGISGALALTIAYILISNNHLERKIKIAIIVILLLSIVVISNSADILSMFSERMDMTRYNGSTDSRMYSILGNIALFIKSPLIGNGSQSVDTYLFQHYVEHGGLGSTIHNTNTLLIFWSSFGIFAGAFVSCLFNKKCEKVTANGLYRAMLFVVMFVIFSNEDFSGSIVFYIFLFYSLYGERDELSERIMAEQLRSPKD